HSPLGRVRLSITSSQSINQYPTSKKTFSSPFKIDFFSLTPSSSRFKPHSSPTTKHPNND
ncbi:MAG: hypothetical protein AB8B69_25555, partial [Chitinophagales bacterium]